MTLFHLEQHQEIELLPTAQSAHHAISSKPWPPVLALRLGQSALSAAWEAACLRCQLRAGRSVVSHLPRSSTARECSASPPETQVASHHHMLPQHYPRAFGSPGLLVCSLHLPAQTLSPRLTCA